MRHLALALFLLAPAGVATPALADPAPEALTFAYSIYAAGLNVVDFTGAFATGAREYRLSIDYHTTGLFSVVVHSRTNSRVNGIWDGNQVDPLQFYSWGILRGSPRRTMIEYSDGMPLIRDLEPPNEGERSPVPVAMQRDTIDTLSAIALLMRHVADTGRCEGDATTFDGRRLARITVRTAGKEMLTASHGSHYSGPALRCDFVGQQLAGFKRDDDPAEVRRPRHGSAWFASVVPGAMQVPVRLAFRTDWFGDAVAYLTSVSLEPAATAAR